MQATSSNLQLLDLCRVNRRGEGKAFQAHAHLDNRRLLWHGTNFATVAAVLKAGLRIMPPASGRVGRGLYMVSCWLDPGQGWSCAAQRFMLDGSSGSCMRLVSNVSATILKQGCMSCLM